MKFNIKKVGNYFVAYDDVEKNVTYGRINIDTGKFVGDTRCLVALSEYQDKHKQGIIDSVLEQIKKDVAEGDLTAIEELLGFLPIKNLKNYLPEIWK
jgi:hypothetical protein